MSRDEKLLVDDVQLNRVILADLFEQEYEVLKRKLTKPRADSPISISWLLFLDIVMPVMDGFQVLKQMTELGLM